MAGIPTVSGSRAMSRDRERIRILNDQMRVAGPTPGDQALWLTTRGLDKLGPAVLGAAVQRVRTFDQFDGDDDPYGEHDFGSFELNGERLFWKIDYYDLSMTQGSPDPADEAATRRVLTIMLALEY